MKLEIKQFKKSCSLKKFKINGIPGNEDHFIFIDDIKRTNDICICGNVVAKKREPNNLVLNRYKINEKQYNKIAKRLENILSIGYCDACKVIENE